MCLCWTSGKGVLELDADNDVIYHSSFIVSSSNYGSAETHETGSVLSFTYHNLNPGHFFPKRLV